MTAPGEVDFKNPFDGIVDTEPPREAIMQRVTQRCLSAACMPRQEELAAAMEIWAAPGMRFTPAECAERILGRMGCGIACPRVQSTAGNAHLCE